MPHLSFEEVLNGTSVASGECAHTSLSLRDGLLRECVIALEPRSLSVRYCAISGRYEFLCDRKGENPRDKRTLIVFLSPHFSVLFGSIRIHLLHLRMSSTLNSQTADLREIGVYFYKVVNNAATPTFPDPHGSH